VTYDPGAILFLYDTLSHPINSGGGGYTSGKKKSKPPISTSAVDLRRDLERWFDEPLTLGCVWLALSRPEFSTWVSVWVDACEALVHGLSPFKAMYGAECLECGTSQVDDGDGGFEPAILYWNEARAIQCLACGGEWHLPDLAGVC
jgi:hypothetical protein